MTQNKLGVIGTYATGLITGLALAGSMLFCQNRAIAGAERAQNAVQIGEKPFADVPANHWAASSIADLKTHGIVQGAPTSNFNGSSFVTRYEMAVVLDRFVVYMEQARKPLNPTTVDPTTLHLIPDGPAKASLTFLSTNGFIEPGSVLLVPPGNKPITADQMSINLSKVVMRISDRSLPPDTNK